MKQVNASVKLSELIPSKLDLPDQHRVLKVHVVVLGSVQEEVGFPPQRLQSPQRAALVVTFEVLIQRPHVALRVVL